MFAVYPDARVVQIHRDPLKSVPSTISLMGTLKSMRSGQVDVDSLTPLVSMGYGLMLDDTLDARDRGELPDDQFVDVLYGDLMRAPVDTLRDVYGALGLAWPAAYGDAVADHLAARPKGARGPHEYSLEALGLDPAVERERFRRYQQHFQVPDEI